MLKRGGKGTWKGPRVASIIRSSVPTMAFFLGLGIEFAHTCYKTCAHQSTRPAHGRLQASFFNTMVTQVSLGPSSIGSRSERSPPPGKPKDRETIASTFLPYLCEKTWRKLGHTLLASGNYGPTCGNRCVFLKTV